jgi:dihydroxyacid dehydratase/phosphogluconate dehydratase
MRSLWLPFRRFDKRSYASYRYGSFGRYEITLKDFQDISDKTPLLADLKPSGKYLMEDLHEVGGVPAVMKYLLKEDYSTEIA